jgi:MFS family permease
MDVVLSVVDSAITCQLIKYERTTSTINALKKKNDDYMTEQEQELLTQVGAIDEVSESQVIMTSDNSKTLATTSLLPKGELFAIMMIFINEGFSYSFLYPFLGFMILDTGVTNQSSNTGYYAGLLAGSFAIAQFFSGFVFGVLSDRFSKKIILLITTIADAACTVMFGLSKTFAAAIFSRSLSGVVNGNIVAKAYLSEITDDNNRAVAFSFIAFAWGLGSIGGPLCGSFLSNPATAYPSLFGNIQILRTYPYLLPCIVTSALMMLEFIVCAIFLNSTTSKQPIGTLPDIHHNTNNRSDQNVKSKFSNTLSYIWLEIKELVAISLNKEVAITSTILALSNLIDAFQEELFPLWSIIPIAEGGLSFMSVHIGIVQIIIGVLLLPQTIIYPFVSNYFGKLDAMRVGFLFIIPLVFTPLLVMLTGNKVLLWIGLVVFSILRSFTVAMTFTAVLIMVNNASQPGTIGRVLSVSNSMACM